MSWERFRAFIDLSRIHGTPIIIGIFLIGVISSKGNPSFIDYIFSIIILFFFKTSGAVLNDLTDYELDSLDPVLRHKPIQSGLISKREVWLYFVFCFLSGLFLSIFYFSFMVTLLLLFALGIAYVYNIRGKFIPLGFEFLFPTSMGILVIAGSYVSGGPTQITLLLSFMIYLTNVIAQWINSLRDVECDRVANVGSIAVLASFDPKNPREKIGITFVFGYILWIIYTFSLIWPFILSVLPLTYLPFVLVIHSFNTLCIFRWSFRSSSRQEFNKILVFQVVSYWFPIPLYLIDQEGLFASFGLLGFVVLGTFLAIAIEKGSQYKITFSEDRTENKCFSGIYKN